MMRNCWIVVLIGYKIALGLAQLSFGGDGQQTNPPGEINSRLGLLASTLGVAPVPGASYIPDKGSSFEGDGQFNSGGGGGSGIPVPGDSYGEVGGVQGAQFNKEDYNADGIQGGNYNRPRCSCVPKHQCRGRPGSVSQGENNGNYGKDPGLVIGNGPGGSGNDGVGVIDIRIVNKPPSAVICLAGDIYCCEHSHPGPQSPPPASPHTCGVPTVIPVPGHAPEYGEADFGEYPWIAVILTKTNNFIGAGALLDSNHIITAAHKLKDVRAETLKIRLGEWNAQDDSEPYKNKEIGVSHIYIHEGYNSQNLNLYNDIAVIKLKYPVDIGAQPHIKPVCLPKHGAKYDGKRCWVAGFGKDAFKVGKHSFYLKEVDLPIVESYQCEHLLQTKTKLGHGFSLNKKSFLCAGGEEGKDACSGDGGAPLVCKGDDGRFQVVGLVAFGIGCAMQDVPGVYVNVPNYVDWIQSKMY